MPTSRLGQHRPPMKRGLLEIDGTLVDITARS
jgi:hypothetical protein